ncbi:heme A synthase [Paracoccus denitrificans]|uniref:Heme A synthase n=1 Tax=Paracoccus denitrificans (strain Pd 1222) TaxID=318586 RepID=CTAA_PARDP|nr:heme A synthase [Paracoccus denitrificans]A1B8C2.2 RecName: Full=Heme A synthase; Short=HAS; AltName: Full=Cytochrome aa3-controlling protein [Paracoccus denitrificans PD1222]MBB4628137.1 cytochrome c oxidase assembly protein subunit 15 [Paracoccus denitrificans]MCU7429202.1 COX15/CtaA family protein [Paracoccus denitrificans]QAR28356.1 heme A synthase [Paracoccus denitrificans]UPV98096.1 COX15/CtaA family protein [Paracoccus denitrificans]WQO36014.1 COX15/CtaA family protein [Paracoccus d
MARRPVFQEVTETTPPGTTPSGGMIDAGHKGARGAIRLWLVVLFVMVAAMIALGGATRLTGSGLSITEWKPVTGAIPPMDAATWQAEFDKYRQIPQFELVNSDMDLASFKRIYWWEWSHRLLGRLVGLVWAAGFVFFLATRRIPTGWTPRLLLLGALGGAQGAIGWWMVHSGLSGEMVRVASYRLATHLGLAFAILGLIAWYVLALSRSEAALLRARRAGEAKLFSMTTGLMHLAFVQILLGALVAGIDAGRMYTGWPTMGGEWIPAEIWDATLGWRNFFENPALVQFIHRMTGYLLAVFAVVVFLRARRSPHPVTRGAYVAMLVALAVQVALGIMNVLHASPLPLALAHQIGAVALFTLILRARHHARYPYETSVRGTVR